MATKMTHALRRELTIVGKPYTLTITPAGLKLAPKGRRKGRELAWRDLVSGEAALAVALNASLQQGAAAGRSSARQRPKPHPTMSRRRRRS
jgi:hypothetical protein